MKIAFKYLFLLILSSLWIYVSLIMTILLNGLLMVDLGFNQALEPAFYFLLVFKIIALGFAIFFPSKKPYYLRIALGVAAGNFGAFIYGIASGNIGQYLLFILNLIIDIVPIMIFYLIIDYLMNAEEDEILEDDIDEDIQEQQDELQSDTPLVQSDSLDFYMIENTDSAKKEQSLIIDEIKEEQTLIIDKVKEEQSLMIDEAKEEQSLMVDEAKDDQSLIVDEAKDEQTLMINEVINEIKNKDEKTDPFDKDLRKRLLDLDEQIDELYEKKEELQKLIEELTNYKGSIVLQDIPDNAPSTDTSTEDDDAFEHEI